MMKNILKYFLLILLLLSLKASAQNYEVPAGYTLKAKEDYSKYEQDVISTADWQQQTPWTVEPQKRLAANTFLMAWLSGSSDVSISIEAPITKITDKNPNLLLIYMGQFAKYTLQHKDAPNKRMADITAIKAVIEKYKAEPSKAKNNDMEKLIKINNEGKLETWLDTVFYKS